MNATIAAEIQRLTPTEKLELVQELWDDIAETSQDGPIPQWHTEELNRRLDNEADDKGRPWEQVRAEIIDR